MPPNSCTECGTRLPAQAETCPDCGYPVTARAHIEHVAFGETSHSTHREYKLIQLLGGVVVVAGIIAALADSPIAAAVSIAVGTATYMTGLLGSWWNRGD